MIHFFALAGSFPELAARINMIPDTTSAMVTSVPMKNVAESTISWTNSPTDVASPSSLTLFLIHRVSYMLSLHCPLASNSGVHVIPITCLAEVSVSVAVSVTVTSGNVHADIVASYDCPGGQLGSAKEKFVPIKTNNKRILIIFFINFCIQNKYAKVIYFLLDFAN